MGRSSRLSCLQRMITCRPFGATFVHTSGKVPQFPTCGQTKTCPWCFARAIQKLYSDLNKGPLKTADKDTYLGIMKVRLSSQEIHGSPVTYGNVMHMAMSEATLNSQKWGQFSPHQFFPTVKCRSFGGTSRQSLSAMSSVSAQLAAFSFTRFRRTGKLRQNLVFGTTFPSYSAYAPKVGIW